MGVRRREGLVALVGRSINDLGVRRRGWTVLVIMQWRMWPRMRGRTGLWIGWVNGHDLGLCRAIWPCWIPCHGLRLVRTIWPYVSPPLDLRLFGQFYREIDSLFVLFRFPPAFCRECFADCTEELMPLSPLARLSSWFNRMLNLWVFSQPSGV